VRLRPVYHVTTSGYLMTGVLLAGAFVCLVLNLRHASDVTLDLMQRMVVVRSAFRAQSVPLSDVGFPCRDSPIEVFGNRVEAVAIFVEGFGAPLRLLSVTPEHRTALFSVRDALAKTSSRPAAEALTRLRQEAEQLPKDDLKTLFGVLAMLVGAAAWAFAHYLLEGP
jgi:hypothetical protein